eukprot:7147140-Lingulodinium_polyedra.AAC.1
MPEVALEQRVGGGGVLRGRGPDATASFPHRRLDLMLILEEPAIRRQGTDASNPGPTESPPPR